jgi:DNA-binding XRE family transcriptional regulator
MVDIMKSNEVFKNIRLDLNLSQIDLSNLLSIKQSTLSNYETGKRKPSLRICYKLIKLAKLKGININIEKLRPDE